MCHHNWLTRLRYVTGTRTAAELAAYFDMSEDEVCEVLRKGEEGGSIPAYWLLVLLAGSNVSPEWILYGRGPERAGVRAGFYADVEIGLEWGKTCEAVREIPSQILAAELLRRLAVAEIRSGSD